MESGARIRIAEHLGGLELIEAVHRRPRFPRHAHPTYAIGVVLRGVNRFRYRGAFHTATGGMICTVTPDEVHEVEPARGVGFEYRCLYPRLELLRETAEATSGRRIPGTPLLPAVIEDTATARLVLAIFESEALRAPRLTVETQLFDLLSRVVTRYASSPRMEPRSLQQTTLNAALARARDFLADNYSCNVSLAELAAAVGLDAFALVRGFTRRYGMPPHAWLVQERVRRAKALLRAGLRLADAATAAGFADQSHLTRHFKRLVGVTPGSYRRAAGAGP